LPKFVFDTAQIYQFKKNKKFYFTDPIIFWLALEWSGYPRPDNWQAMIAEMVGAEVLLRRYPRMGYVSTRKGEIDFVAPKQWAIEVKWATAPTNLSRAYVEGIFPEKFVWTKEQFGILPKPRSPLDE
jgi:predicted AAA+ superfamily ATPase